MPLHCLGSRTTHRSHKRWTARAVAITRSLPVISCRASLRGIVTDGPRLFCDTALWMREAPPDADLCWRELALVAKALADGRDMTEIGLMRDIALRTIAVLRSAGRM